MQHEHPASPRAAVRPPETNVNVAKPMSMWQALLETLQHVSMLRPLRVTFRLRLTKFEFSDLKHQEVPQATTSQRIGGRCLFLFAHRKACFAKTKKEGAFHRLKHPLCPLQVLQSLVNKTLLIVISLGAATDGWQMTQQFAVLLFCQNIWHLHNWICVTAKYFDLHEV